MDILQQSALAWKELTEYKYLLTYGYKKLHPINLTFSFEDYPHLAGFQYLKDILLPNFASAKIVDRILEGKILFKQIEKARQYEEMVMPKMYPFVTTIKADYLIASYNVINSFVFIIQASANGIAKCDFLCCSAFEQGKRDYEVNQRSYTLLEKERLHIPSNTLILFFLIKSPFFQRKQYKITIILHSGECCFQIFLLRMLKFYFIIPM